MKKRSAPPLYELIRSRGGERQAAARTPVDRPEPDDAGETLVSCWLQPGRYIQVPVGYLFVAGALVLLVAAVAFMVGHSRGHNSARAVVAEEMESAHLLDEARRPRDPLDRQVEPTVGPTQQRSTLGPTSRRDTAASATSSRWGPIDSDPRQAGLNYFILATTTPEGAQRLAEYCRERGLETYVVSSNNARLRRVIALPGFEAGQRTSQAARDVEALIHRIGDTWSRTEPGATNLRDAYPERFRG